jgi:hypothetical protein
LTAILSVTVRDGVSSFFLSGAGQRLDLWCDEFGMERFERGYGILRIRDLVRGTAFLSDGERSVLPSARRRPRDRRAPPTVYTFLFEVMVGSAETLLR